MTKLNLEAEHGIKAALLQTPNGVGLEKEEMTHLINARGVHNHDEIALAYAQQTPRLPGLLITHRSRHLATVPGDQLQNSPSSPPM